MQALCLLRNISAWDGPRLTQSTVILGSIDADARPCSGSVLDLEQDAQEQRGAPVFAPCWQMVLSP